MLFDSAAYVVFLCVVVAAYWHLKPKGQNYFLLIASYFFYGWWDWRFLLLMAASTFIDFHVARRIRAAKTTARRRSLLIVSLLLNFGVLGYFKYLNFFLDSFAHIAGSLGMHNTPHLLLQIILPPAISFYTFQEVAYIVDVYSGKLEPAQSLVDYALFISLFPHLIAGPIQRPSHLLPQVQRPREFDNQQVYDGCMLILLGLFRKCVVADSCAALANAVFSGRMGHTVMATLIGAYAFAWQIYADFSGYSDIARGSAQLLGFHFMPNFRQPYLATSMQDFWRRWHISLSTWLRDYLYIPLGGSRGGTLRTYRNLIATMLLGGLWHGASWNFVIWGGLHGGGLATERLAGLAEESAARPWLRRILLFHGICLGWIFFRAETLDEALAMLRGLAHWSWTSEYFGAVIYLAAVVLPLFLVDLYLEHTKEEYPLQNSSFPWQLASAAAAILAVGFLSANQSNAFVYFQF